MTENHQGSFFKPSDKDSGVLNDLEKCWWTRHEWTPKGLGISSRRTENAYASKTTQESKSIYSTRREDVEHYLREVGWHEGLEGEVTSFSETAHQQLRHALMKQSSWKTDRKGGARKAGADVQAFLVAIGTFFQEFSGIAELMQGVDWQYGGLAYGTISLLLSAAMHKQKRQESIEEGLKEIAYAFPRLTTLKNPDLEPSVNLKRLIAAAFAQSIEFCREAVDYYNSRVNRMKGVFSPSASKFEALSEVRKLLAQAREEVDILLFKSIMRMRHKMDEMSLLIRKADERSDRRDLEKREANDMRLRSLLRITEPCANTDTRRCKMLLENVFDEQRADQDSPCRVTWKLIEENTEYARWLTCNESCLLLFGGENHRKSDAGPFNWLSYASVFTVERMKGSVAYYYCQTPGTSKRCTFQEVVRRLVWQLTTQISGNLSTLMDSMGHQAAEDGWQQDNVREAELQNLIDYLSSVLKLVDKSDPIYIVIDRIDQCSCYGEVYDFSDNWLAHAIVCFRKMAKQATRCLKVLLVTDGTVAQLISQIPVLESEKTMCKYFCESNWVHPDEV